MKRIVRQILLALVLAIAVVIPRGLLIAAGPAPVDLRAAAYFSILAATAISSTGGGTNHGDVGLSPTTGAAITGLSTAQVHGIIYARCFLLDEHRRHGHGNRTAAFLSGVHHTLDFSFREI